MPTMDQDLSQDCGVEFTARDVLDEEELAEYCWAQGGKPWDKVTEGDAP